MSEVWLTIGVLCIGTVAIKSTGPLALGGRRPSERAFAVLGLFAPALLAALVVFQTLGDGDQGPAVDERLAGVAAAGAALALKLPLWVVVVGAAAVTAALRAI